MRELSVVGGGVIGLSVAWRAAARGHHVTVYDPEPGRGASWLAGGMLAPVTEAWPGEEDVLTLGEASLRRWPDFARDLAEEGVDPGLSPHGTLVVALDSADSGNLEMLAAYLAELGREVERLTGREVRRAEPGLAGSVRSGLLVPGDLAVDNRRLLRSLEHACGRHGVEFRRETVTDLDGLGDVVLAAGAWTGRLHPALADAVRPLKGEILRLRPRRGCLPSPTRTVRAMVEGRPIYLVPRDDGGLVLGATQYEAGFDETVTVRGVRELLEGAERVFPGITEYELVETAAGLRAASVDTMPFIGELGGGVFAATGHHRNGLLMAPVTADAAVAWLDGGPLPDEVAAAAPSRRSEERV
ncbi:glycine oxidase ThiO [Amycolatopsis azurea]|uniref:glycine oxidase n=1 Tax=Amycolatopsis azurea DSM 43854 TaxID=1238180 RepID=M2PLQ0_9PSEU|nr:glycine oxidase ThiO [Amycolatopsis azurea]EMD25423.1 Glycine oxidase ThiO [Amycolatopsis azurea DSM 43854]OOC08583.1 glycine oxidase ThiO [Amycolatopsis azurea DSM 43854]